MGVWNESKPIVPPSKLLTDHEYHEISDEENAAESPRFEVSFKSILNVELFLFSLSFICIYILSI